MLPEEHFCPALARIREKLYDIQKSRYQRVSGPERVVKKGRTPIYIGIVALSLTLLLVVWSPWITKNYAINRVVVKLSGAETRYNYLGQDMAVKDIPKEVVWFPFGRYVYFPGEAGWFVSFYGAVSP
jgi:hypothetical protein